MSNFVHHELHTSDTDAAKRFYNALFGWKYQDMPMPDGVYTMISAPDGTGIGGFSAANPDVDPGWLGYITVASVDAAAKTTLANGGQVVFPKQEVPGMGWFAWCLDPQGNRFAVWEVNPASVPAPAAKKKAAKKKAKKKAAKKVAKKATKKATKKAAKKSAKTSAKKAAKKPANKAANKPAKKAKKKARKK